MKLADFLSETGMSVSKFAEKVGVAEASVSRYATGKRMPKPEVLRRIAQATGGRVQANDFVDGAIAPGPAETDERSAFRAAHPGTVAVDMLLCDINGILRGKRLGIESLDKIYSGEVVLPGSTYALDITGADVDETGVGQVSGDLDYFCWPVEGTLAPVPWARQPRAQVLTSMRHEDGRRYFLDPREVARGVIARFAGLGLTPVIALELEFYLLDRERDAEGRPQPPVSPLTGLRATDTRCYDMDSLDEHATVIDGIAAACAAQGIPASVATAEYAPSQYEINLHHQTDALAACDHAVLLKRAIKGVARRHGMEATFMAKPFMDISGNGLHIHVSLLDEDGRNIFEDGRAHAEETLGYAIGGMQETMAESMAIFAPNANSFRRLRPNSYAPLATAWGYNNRTVALRIPATGGAARRVEHRTAGADANPYLTAAAVLAGIHHGLAGRIGADEPVEGNAFAQRPETLPSNWVDTLRLFDSGAVIAGYLGAEYCRIYSACKWQELHAFAARITPTEYDWYLSAL